MYNHFMVTLYGKNFVWMHLSRPSEEDILELAQNKDLHPLVADELVHPTFRPKVEHHDSHLYLILHVPKFDARDSSHGAEIDIVIGKDFFITTQYARVPALEEAEILRGWGGLYETTPDHHPVLGEVPEVKGFYLAAGFSGHGFMHAPVTGQLLADLLIRGKPSIDVSSLALSRFREGKLIVEKNVI